MERYDSASGVSSGPLKAMTLHRHVIGPRDAPVVLVLHGITESRRYWLPHIRPLATRYRLLIPDLPGFGLSPKPHTDYTPEFFVKALLDFLDEETPADAPVAMIGHSLGALLAFEIAARLGERVKRLALLSVPRFDDPEQAHRAWLAGSFSYRNLLATNSLAANVAQMRRTGVRLTARYLRRLPWSVVSDSRRFTFRSLTSTLEHCLLRYRVDDILALAPRIPVLLIHGEADQVAPLANLRDLPSLPPYPVLQVIRGAGHHPFHTHAELCVPLIEAHLAGAASASSGSTRVGFTILPPGSGRERATEPLGP